MELNRKNFKKFFIEHFEGNYNKTARALNVSPAQVYRIIKGDSKAGAKFLGKLIAYCKAHNIDYDKLIFLPTLLTVCNAEHTTPPEGREAG